MAVGNSNFKYIVSFSALLLFVVFMDVVSSLKCYQCQLRDGSGDAGCGENPPPEKFLRECAQPQCWMRYSSNGTLSVERFCVAVATNMNGCMAAMVTDTKGMTHTGFECKCSNTDGCNGDSPSGISSSSGQSDSSSQT